MAAVGAYLLRWPCMATVRSWPVPWAPYGRRGGVAGPLGPVRPPLGRGQSPGPCKAATGRGRSSRPRMASEGAWLVPWALYACRAGVVGPLGPVWPPWRRGLSPGPRLAARGHVRFPGPRMVVVGAWPVPWAPYGRRSGVSGLLGPVWLLWGRHRSPVPRIAAVGAWLVLWTP